MKGLEEDVDSLTKTVGGLTKERNKAVSSVEKMETR